MSAIIWAQRDPLTRRPLVHGGSGLYVVQFPDRIKIGKAGDMRARVLRHATDGATRAIGMRVENERHAEREALRVFERAADRIRRTESFTGISFTDAEHLLATVIRRIEGDWPDISLVWWAHEQMGTSPHRQLREAS